MFRNVKEDQITMRHFFAIPFGSFSISGIKLFKWDDNDNMSRLNRIYLTINLCNVFINFFTKTCFIIFERVENTVQLTALGVFTGFGINALLKMSFVWHGRHTLRYIIMEMNRTFPRTKEEREEYQVQEHYTLINRYSRSLYIFHWLVAGMFMIFPIIQSTVEYYSGWTDDGKFVYRFPYIMTYPFNEKQPLAFPIVYFSQFLAGSSCTSYFLGSDLLLVTTVHLLNMQFNYLKLRIEKLQPQGDPQRDLQQLEDLLLYHHRILDFSERINNVFRLSILLNYMISILVICLIGFQVVVGSNFLDLFKFLGFLCSSLAHIYFICFFGTNLLILSTDISDAISGHRWYDARNSYQRILPLAIARAQKPAHLTAFKFFIISMESFTKLMTTSYQFFALINNNYEENTNNK